MNGSAYRPPGQFSMLPPVIMNLLIINALCFLAQLSPAFGDILVRWFALWPLAGPDVVRTPAGLEAVPNFYPWQLLTYSFLHGDFGHLFFNMFSFWMFGFQLENSWGSKRFMIFYFICVAGGGLLQLLATYGAFTYTIGASAGTLGILVAFGMEFPENIILVPIPVKAKYFVMFYGALVVFQSFAGGPAGVAHWAHLGGMVFGVLYLLYRDGKLPLRPGGGGGDY